MTLLFAFNFLHLIFVLAPLLLCERINEEIDHNLDNDWTHFRLTFGKSYTNQHHHNQRRRIWQSNFRKIEDHNRGNHSFKLKMNKFGDLTHAEFIKTMTGFEKPQSINMTFYNETRKKRTNIILPDSIDWRTYGYVTPVKKQGPCGSCWAYAANVALEGQLFRKMGRLLSISEQYVIDCARSGTFVDTFGQVEPKVSGITKNFMYTAKGCSGGSIDAAFQFFKYNAYFTSSSYPQSQTYQQGICNASPSYRYLNEAKQTGFVHVYPSGSESALKNAIATIGPISVAIDANNDLFQFYASGIYSVPNCFNINHAVGVIGYGSDGPNKDYYIIKNSWGLDWGSSGYAKIARNQENMCQIASYASYPSI